MIDLLSWHDFADRLIYPMRACPQLLCHAAKLEEMLKDLQFLAAAGEGDVEQQNGVLSLIRSYLCLLKAEQQVRSCAVLHLSCPIDSSSALCRQLCYDR